MVLNNKYAIGCHIMFYEVDMIQEYLDSIYKSLSGVDNKENVTIDMLFNISEYFEEIDTNLSSREVLLNKFNNLIDFASNVGCNINYEIYEDNDNPYTIAEYRRDFNYKNCLSSDLLIWGESDCLIPSKFFEVLEQIKDYSKKNDTNRFVCNFAIRKMWDESWSILEHPKFTNSTYYEMDEPKALTEPSSIRYTMSYDEMEEVNRSSNSQFDIRVLNYPKFNGCGLVISSDLVKSGVNIPHGCLMVGEDTGFMESCRLHMKENYIQFVVKDLLLVHNRNHPKKRMYVKDENQKLETHYKRGQKDWYKLLRDMSNENLRRLYDGKTRFLTYEDFKNEKKKISTNIS